MAGLRFIGKVLLFLLLFVIATALSAVAHLDTAVGRRAGRVIANTLITDLIAGRLDIGRIDSLNPGHIVARNVSLYDPRGTRVIQANEVVLVLDVLAALDGTLRFSHAELHRGHLRLEEREITGLTFLEALGAREPSTEPSTGKPFHAIVDDMRLDRVVAYGAMLGATGLHARDLRVHMRMEFEEEMDIRVYGGHGSIDGPMDFVATLDDITAHVSSRPHEGSTVYARLHYEDQRLRAHMRYAVPEGKPDDAPPELALILHADPLDLATVYRIGFDWAEPFHGRGSGYVRLFGPPEQLAMSAALDHEAGPIVLEGRLPSEGDVVIDASTTGVDVARLMPGAPSVPIAGRIRLVTGDDATGRPATLHADVRPFAYEGFAIPTLTVDASLLEDRVRIDSVDAPYNRTGEVRASGYATYEGDAHIVVDADLGDVRSDPNVQQFADGARGRTTLHATIDRENSVLTVSARGRIASPALGDVAAGDVRFRLESRTDEASRTRLSLETDAVDLRVGPVMLGDGSANLRSSGDGYAFEGTFDDPRVNGQTSVSGRLATRGDSQVLDHPRIRYTRRRVTLDLGAERIEIAPGRTFVANGASLVVDGQEAARMNARWSAHGSDNAQLVLDGVPLDAISRLFAPALPELDGVLRGTASVAGDLESNPTVEIHAELHQGAIRSLENVNGAFDVTLDRGAIAGRFDVDAGDAGGVSVRLTGTAPITLPTLSTAVREGEYDFDASIESLDLARVASGLLGTTDAGVSGCIDGNLELAGYLAFAPTLSGNLSIGDLVLGNAPPLELAVTSRYDGQNLELSASVGADTTPSDGRRVGRCRETATARLEDGTTFASEGLGELYANVQIPLVELLADPAVLASELQVVPWGLSVRIPPRDLATLPDSFEALVPESLREFRAAGSFTALGGFGTVQASLVATLDYVGDTQRFVCARGSRPRFSLFATHTSGETRGRLETFVGPSRVTSALFRTALPIDDWLTAGAMGELPPMAIDAAVTPADYADLGDQDPPPVEASTIPYLCEYFTGPFAGEVHIDNLFTDEPALSGILMSTELKFHRIERSIRGTVRNAIEETPIIPEIALKFAGGPNRLDFNHDMTWWREHSVSQVSGFVDWTWNREHPVPLVADDAAFDLRLDAPVEGGTDESARTASALPLQMLAGWIPIFGRVDGDLEATLHAFGHLDDPELEGRLAISDGMLTLQSIGQRLRNVNGIVEIRDGEATIASLNVRDENGTAAIDGSIALDGWDPTRFDLHARADEFPIRDEGSIIARLTGRAEFGGTLDDTQANTSVDVLDLDIALEPPSSQTPIGLAEHPDVRIVGLAAAPEAVEEPYPILVHLHQTPRFWVRSEDFSAQVSTELEVTYDDPDIRLSGSLEMHRGFFEVMGKRFEVEQGSMLFDGGSTLDPVVSLVAVHQLRGGGRNDIVVVRASGTLSAPVIEFSSPLVTTGDQGQVICLLITGGTSGQCGETGGVSSPTATASAAGTQAAQFITGVAFGLATLTLREQFGEYIPMVAIETGVNTMSPRFRVGFNAEQVIPERLRSVVRGIYVEGYVNTGTTNTTTGSGSAGGSTASSSSRWGVSIEMQFPHNIVTEGEYAPQNSSWRLGVTWEP